MLKLPKCFPILLGAYLLQLHIPPSLKAQSYEPPGRTKNLSSSTWYADPNGDVGKADSTPVQTNRSYPPSSLEPGGEIILKPSETWRSQTPAVYRMPSSATKAIRGTAVPYTIWYDDSKWKQTVKLNVYAEHSLQSANGKAAAIVVVNPQEFPLEVLKDIVIKNAKENGIEKAVVISDQKRLVNGAEVLFIHWKADIKGSEVEFLTYIHSDAHGTVMVHTYTPVKDFHENQKAMQNFLNGLVFTSGE